MKIKLFSKDTKVPMKSHTPDIGLDVFMPQSFSIDPLETKTISLELGIEVPEGFAGMLVPRSSVAAKGLIIQTSIIDPCYTGNIHLIVTNCSKETQCIEKGMRLCSLVIYSVLNARVEIVNDFSDDLSSRKTSGLGSSGL